MGTVHHLRKIKEPPPNPDVGLGALQIASFASFIGLLGAGLSCVFLGAWYFFDLLLGAQTLTAKIAVLAIAGGAILANAVVVLVIRKEGVPD